jgi:hypothetical protein
VSDPGKNHRLGRSLDPAAVRARIALFIVVDGGIERGGRP